MPVRGTPEEIQSKWLSRIQAATPEVQAGIQRVTKAPGAAAAAQKTAWVNNTMNAQDKWARNVGSVTVDQWKAAATAGVGRIAQGAQAKQDKVGAHLASFIPHLNQGLARIDAMPRGTLEQNLARMLEMARWNSTYKRPAR